MTRILLIEDNEDDALQVRSQLSFAEIAHCTTLRDAIVLLTHQLFDLILLDLSLPDMKGDRMIDKALESLHSFNTPIAALSGTNNSVLINKIKQSGTQFFPKNEALLTQDFLAKALSGLLNQHGDDSKLSAIESSVFFIREELSRLHQEKVLIRLAIVENDLGDTRRESDRRLLALENAKLSDRTEVIKGRWSIKTTLITGAIALVTGLIFKMADAHFSAPSANAPVNSKTLK